MLLMATVLSYAQQLVSIQQISTTGVTTLSFISPLAQYDVVNYKVVYTTLDVDGNTVNASGILSTPQNIVCDAFPLAVYEHGTVLRKDDVPSRDNFEALIPKLLASTGKIAVAPDYLGLGDAPGLHPYLHAESQATATLDMIRAVRDYFQDSSQFMLNGQVFVTGYSQGGHAAMATVKYIQDNQLESEFNVVGAGPASGPYNLSDSQAASILNDQPYSNPGYLVYLLFGMNRVYGNIFDDYDELLKSPYDSILPPLFDGTNDMAAVNAVLPDTISGFLQDSVLQNVRADSVNRQHPIWQALEKNTNYDWKPNFPMELYYCTMDEQVDFQNALDAEAAMTARGATVTAVNKGALNHGDCVLPSLTGASNLMDSLTVCGIVSMAETTTSQLVMYPNPSRDKVAFRGLPSEARLSLFNLGGQLILTSAVENEQWLDITTLKAGVYVVKVEGHKQVYSLKLQVN